MTNNYQSFLFAVLRSIEQNTIFGGQLLYNIVLASATHQLEPLTGEFIGNFLKAK